jgi:hypothetical protein
MMSIGNLIQQLRQPRDLLTQNKTVYWYKICSFHFRYPAWMSTKAKVE